MTRILACLSVLFLAMCSAQARAQSAPVTSSGDIPIVNATFPDLCTGETVVYNGTIHYTAITQYDSGGGVTIIANETFSNVVGIGQTTGAQYQITGGGNFASHQQVDELVPVEFTQISKNNIIGSGPVPNEKLRTVIHFTVNPNGDLAASVENMSEVCK